MFFHETLGNACSDKVCSSEKIWSKIWASEKIWKSDKNLKSELFRNFRSTDLISDFFSEVQKFSELQIFCQVADIADSLTVAAPKGNLMFFITMTCNSNWPEIQSQLHPGQDFTDIPVVVVWVFKHKLALLLQILKSMFPQAGWLLYCIHSIEFQKCGLPHTHILVKYASDCIHPDDINSIVSAEVPDDLNDALLVNTFMCHNHPTLNWPPSKYCQYELPDATRACRFKYPHPLQPMTTIDTDGRIHYQWCRLSSPGLLR